jgi:hypothetical protein
MKHARLGHQRSNHISKAGLTTLANRQAAVPPAPTFHLPRPHCPPLRRGEATQATKTQHECFTTILLHNYTVAQQPCCRKRK